MPIRNASWPCSWRGVFSTTSNWRNPRSTRPSCSWPRSITGRCPRLGLAMLDRRALRKIGVVFWREYVATVRTKAFVMALVSLPLLSLISLCVPLLGGVGGRLPDLRCVVIDQTGGALFSALEQAAERHNRLLAADQPTSPNGRVFVEAWPSAYDQQAKLTLADQVRSGELFGFVEIGHDVLDLERGR